MKWFDFDFHKMEFVILDGGSTNINRLTIKEKGNHISYWNPIMTNDDLIAYVSVKKSKWIYVHHMRNKIHLISNAE